MILKRLLYSALSIFLLTSCKQLKTLTAQDHSAITSRPVKAKNKGVTFLDDITVTPGQVVTSRHTATGPVAPKSLGRPASSTGYSSSGPGGDIERADWLQLKYAIMLDATVEKLNNVSLLKLIDEWWGTRYCMGGSSKSCIDCSAFTQVVMHNAYNIDIPRTAQEQYDKSEQIGLETLSEGDLVFFNTGGRAVSHVGIYLLNNKFVHAATSGGVMVSDLNDSYWKDRFKGAGRFKATGTP
ncbi:MAG: lipoprotein NlpC precursor [Segetibacter sp.]|nr:lipoprotein NlpC precursor [Segetibacter sp.]